MSNKVIINKYPQAMSRIFAHYHTFSFGQNIQYIQKIFPSMKHIETTLMFKKLIPFRQISEIYNWKLNVTKWKAYINSSTLFITSSC